MWPAWRDVSKKGSNLLSQVQELGLQVAYTEDQGTYGWIRKLLALPFLPYTEITTQFERLRLGAEGPRKGLAEYIASQWIYNTIFPVKDWSVFMQPIRTSNDIEGWHNTLNRRASGRSSLPFYLLIQLLNQEARLVAEWRTISWRVSSGGNIAFCRPNCMNSGSSTSPGKRQQGSFWSLAQNCMGQPAYSKQLCQHSKTDPKKYSFVL